ncbi:MAG: AAA family ATPase [candidate division KSB1 bacterium]|nr:AAA family ATPase [candidate division KSB1 bacterium]MDZ7335390.1 AAA family ATPase [candidate division KSB1 bacterium]MDZ7356430.1 AAA family ATPase [candidate division KSB1 bacterium]MDZ7375156.1 AAA family ATPase [candidate division KSB1 bacterium]MDZ7401201.1 AAA family ATPase [candidate division KSB1 bacterium]
MIKRIRIEGYTSFRALDLELKPLAVIFGPNASGKSNILDAIFLISRLATQKNINEAFIGHRGFLLESFLDSVEK